MRFPRLALGFVSLACGTVFAAVSCSSSSQSPTPGPDASVTQDASIDTFVAAMDAGRDTTSSADSGADDVTDAAADVGVDAAPLPTLGNGTFADASIVDLVTDGGRTGSYGLVAADFNKDHKLDIAAGGSGGIFIALGNGDGTFGAPKAVGIGPADGGSETYSLALIDANSDGNPDLAVGATVNGSFGVLYVLIGNGDGSFQTDRAYPYDAGEFVLGIGTGDFNGDTHPDIVTTGDNGVNVFLNAGDAAFGTPSPISVAEPYDVTVTDVNGDQKPDLVLGSSDTNVFVLLGLGNGQFGAPSAYTAAPSDYPYALAVADFTGDNLLDIATENYDLDTVGVLAGLTDGGFHTPPALVDAGATELYGMTVGDYNGDGKPDLALNSEKTAEILVLLNTGSSFAPPAIYPQPSVGSTIITADFNGDRKLDLAVYCYNQVSVFLGH